MEINWLMEVIDQTPAGAAFIIALLIFSRVLNRALERNSKALDDNTADRSVCAMIQTRTEGERAAHEQEIRRVAESQLKIAQIHEELLTWLRRQNGKA